MTRGRNIHIIEDAAHSLTARLGETPVGTQADITCFSFYATKGVTAGEGGMAVMGGRTGRTASAGYAARLVGRSLVALRKRRVVGLRRDRAGLQVQPDRHPGGPRAGADGRAEEMRQRRESIARRYTEALRGVPGIKTPSVAPAFATRGTSIRSRSPARRRCRRWETRRVRKRGEGRGATRSPWPCARTASVPASTSSRSISSAGTRSVSASVRASSPSRSGVSRRRSRSLFIRIWRIPTRISSRSGSGTSGAR